MRKNHAMNAILLAVLVSIVIHPATIAKGQVPKFDATIVFEFTDPNGNPVTGACLFGAPIAFTYSVCDNHDGSKLPPRHASPDWNPQEGVIELRNHYSGSDATISYSVVTLPDGYALFNQQNKEFPVNPVANQTVTYRVKLQLENPRSESESSISNASCEIVELYPGYPGYRGVVAGLVGRSDTACLSDLQLADPNFTKEQEDSANRQAANSLGVVGQIADWTWETWMAIGAERGLGHICYSCLWLATPSVVPTGPIPNVSSNDPRLELMSFESYGFQNRFVAEHGVAAYHTNRISDGELRILASLQYVGHPTAFELTDAADRLLGAFFSVPGYERIFVGFQNAKDYIVCRAGYAPTVADMHPDDQTNLVYIGLLTSIGSDLTMQVPPVQYSEIAKLDRQLRDWRADNLTEAPQSSFAEYIATEEGIHC